ncbi:MAG TPA: hypothetical protein DHW64_12485 [Chitinophagaceae bacterium]|nr:hypothetical protein [Chitinophagaceae bacterium]
MRLLLLLSLFFPTVLCAQIKKVDTVFLKQLLLSKPELFNTILQNRDSLRVQIMYTQIDRDKKNKPVFTDFSFHLNPNEYFYPASTVKMPVAFLALEKLSKAKRAGAPIHLQTTIITDSVDMIRHINRLQDTVPNRSTIERFIKQIFLVSDNDAFNRLYEYLGQEFIQQSLAAKGYPDAIIRHWLSVSRTDEQNRRSRHVAFLTNTGGLLTTQPPTESKAVFPPFQSSIGKGYYAGNQLAHEPFVFDSKNRVYLKDFHRMLQTVMMPDAFPKKQRFDFTKEDYQFLYRWMSAFPSESESPKYDTSKVGDASAKFLFYGAAKGRAPKHIRIFNKIGGAYGFLTDVCYFVDFEKKIEFFLSATILCNSDGIFNDDKYDYDSIGYPFLKHLGQLIYEHELQRKKKRLPDLSRYKVEY